MTNEEISHFIKERSFTLRGIEVMLDSDLAYLYGLETRSFNQTFKRNIHRFDDSFCFQISQNEAILLTSQNVMSVSNGKNGKNNIGGRTHLPYVFTFEGTVLICGILNSSIAIERAKYVAKEFARLKTKEKKNQEIFTMVSEFLDMFKKQLYNELDDKYISKEVFKNLTSEIIDYIETSRKTENDIKEIGFQGKWNSK